jgi:hypothetical protein
MKRNRTPLSVEDCDTAKAYLKDMDNFTALRAEQEEECFVLLNPSPQSSVVRSEAPCE